MKIKDFGKKPKSTNRSTKIVVQNDALLNKHKAEISELNTQLEYYKQIETERDEAVKRKTSIEEILKSERFEAEKNRETLVQLEQEKNKLSSMVEKIPELEEALRVAKGQSNSRQTELDEMTKRALKQSEEISLLKPKLEKLTFEFEEQSKETTNAISLKQSAEASLDEISNKNKELKSFADETSKINKQLVEKNRTLGDWAAYKDTENKGLLNQLEKLQSVKTNLQEWTEKMDIKYSNLKSSKNSLENKVSTQQKNISDMNKTLDDLIKEMTHITKLNTEYKKELAKPRYTSMASIASQEGFVMPNGKENVRTHNLGNYKPTLLKFKKEEVANG